MQILFVTHHALPHVGGLETAVDGLARALAARGHHVEQIAPIWEERHTYDEAPGGVAVDSGAGDVTVDPGGEGGVGNGGAPGVPVHHRVRAWHGVERLTGRPYPVPGPAFVRLTREAARRAEVIHAHGFLVPSTAISLAIASRIARREVGPVRVLTDHASVGAYASPVLSPLESLVVGTVGQLALRSTQAVVALNPRIERQIEELRPGKLIVSIPNGVDHDTYRPPEEGERDRLRERLGWDERPRILFVGRLVPRKGADLAVEVARAIGSEAELVLAGSGDVGELPANATALGPMPPGEVAELYRAADSLLLPSHNEGFPMTVLEAMASGLPVVVADDPAYGPYLDDAPRGVARAERATGPLLEALRALGFGREIDAAGRAKLAEFTRGKFSWDRSAAAHEALYEDLIARRAGS
jgi:D-inositol-3-phosphate glycosyltransferase